jgi:hypothetical protein
MSEVMRTPAQVSAAIRELDGLANLLGLPNQERCGILGLTGSAYRLWYSGSMRAELLITAELVRRLGYALPLMRRMAAHMPTGAMAHGQNRSRAMGDERLA